MLRNLNSENHGVDTNQIFFPRDGAKAKTSENATILSHITLPGTLLFRREAARPQMGTPMINMASPTSSRIHHVVSKYPADGDSRQAALGWAEPFQVKAFGNRHDNAAGKVHKRISVLGLACLTSEATKKS